MKNTEDDDVFIGLEEEKPTVDGEEGIAD